MPANHDNSRLPARLPALGLAGLALLLLVLLTLPWSAQAQTARSWHLSVLKTAYCLHGQTATGTTTHWGSIAVDPRLIPLGSRLYVPGYGRGRAEDTGGAVRGAHIDVWMPSCAAALRATRHVTITVYR